MSSGRAQNDRLRASPRPAPLYSLLRERDRAVDHLPGHFRSRDLVSRDRLGALDNAGQRNEQVRFSRNPTKRACLPPTALPARPARPARNHPPDWRLPLAPDAGATARVAGSRHEGVQGLWEASASRGSASQPGGATAGRRAECPYWAYSEVLLVGAAGPVILGGVDVCWSLLSQK